MQRSLERSLLTALTTLVSSVALPTTAWSNVVTVACPGGTKTGDYSSISDALAALDRFGPHQIFVSGTCTEDVVIAERERVSIIGMPPIAEIVGSVALRESHNMLLQGLTIRGASLAINVNANAEVDVWTCVIRNNGVGIETSGPRTAVRLFASSIQNNSTGLFLTDGTFAQIVPLGPKNPPRFTDNQGVGIFARGATIYATNLVVENNGTGIVIDGGKFTLQTFFSGFENAIRGSRGDGMQITNGASASIAGKLQVSGNGGSGIALSASAANFSEVSGLGGFTVENNTNWGILVTNHSELGLFGQHTIRNNSNPKLEVGSGVAVSRSALTIQGGTQITQNVGAGILADFNSNVLVGGRAVVTDNTRDGFRLRRRAVGSIAPPVTIENNGGHSISCSPSALISGDLSTISDVDCAEVESGARNEGAEVDFAPVALDIPRRAN